MINFYRWIF